MAWMMNNQKLSPMGLIKDEMTLGYMFGQKCSATTTLDLMQNCDLPPPLKVFSLPDKTTNNIWSTMDHDDKDEALTVPKQDSGIDNFELLKALRRSQTRAREAERKCKALHNEKDALSNLLVQESTRLLAYRNWVKVLELQILQLKTQQQYEQKQEQEHVHRWQGTTEDEDNKNVASSVTLFMAVAFCLGVAGVGLALGFRYMF